MSLFIFLLLKLLLSQCEIGWQFNEQSKHCETICGDLMIAGKEQCDDGNLTPFDGCFDCQFQCQSECDECIEGSCQNCILGWGLFLESSKAICNPCCGDGIVIEGYEDYEYGDVGCIDCQYSCPSECTKCQIGLCLECKEGWILVSHECIPKCGDGLVVGYEECDDMNEDANDGCYNCYFQCDNNCTKCVGGLCFECGFGMQINNKENKCQFICGDGIHASSEDCDNGNLYDEDGCNSSCKIEFFWQCEDIGYTSYCIQDYSIRKNPKPQEIQISKSLLTSTQKFNTSVVYTFFFISILCILTGSVSIFWNILDQLQYISYIKQNRFAFSSTHKYIVSIKSLNIF